MVYISLNKTDYYKEEWLANNKILLDGSITGLNTAKHYCIVWCNPHFDSCYIGKNVKNSTYNYTYIGGVSSISLNSLGCYITASDIPWGGFDENDNYTEELADVVMYINEVSGNCENIIENIAGNAVGNIKVHAGLSPFFPECKIVASTTNAIIEVVPGYEYISYFGDTVIMYITIRNNGNLSGDCGVKIYVNNVYKTQLNISLSPGSTKIFNYSFNMPYPSNIPGQGEYTANIKLEGVHKTLLGSWEIDDTDAMVVIGEWRPQPKINTSISFNYYSEGVTNPSEITLGQELRVIGTLNDSRGSYYYMSFKTLKLYSNGIFGGNITTDNYGRFDMPLSIISAGMFINKIVFEGDDEYNSSELSKTIIVNDIPDINNIEITVIDTLGNIIQGVNIYISGKSCTTGLDGKCIVGDLLDGTYSITAVKSGYVLQGEPTVIIPIDINIIITMKGSEVKYNVMVNVYDYNMNVPVIGANVKIGINETTTDINGDAVFYISKGTYELIITKEDYECVSGCGTISILSDVNIYTKLRSTILYNVTFNTIDIDGNPLEGVQVYISGKDCISNIDGECTINDITKGTYSITAVLPYYTIVNPDDIRNVVIDSDKTINIIFNNIPMPPSVTNLKAESVVGGIKLIWDNYPEIVEGDFPITTTCPNDETKTCFIFDHYHMYIDGVLSLISLHENTNTIPTTDLLDHTITIHAVGTSGLESEPAVVIGKAKEAPGCLIPNPFTIDPNDCLLSEEQANWIKWGLIGLVGIYAYSITAPARKTIGKIFKK